MTIDDLVTWFAVKGAGVCVDRSPLGGFPGYVRHVSVMPDARVIVEFLWADTDEGGPTYVASCESVLAAVGCGRSGEVHRAWDHRVEEFDGPRLVPRGGIAEEA
jgi:hypothetical protein